MNCPTCNVELRMTQREGVEIDYCPTCRGVWLDRGELDKIIDRSVGEFRSDRGDSGYLYNQQDRYPERGREHPHGNPKRKKRESFLSDLFDFD